MSADRHAQRERGTGRVLLLGVVVWLATCSGSTPPPSAPRSELPVPADGSAEKSDHVEVGPPDDMAGTAHLALDKLAQFDLAVDFAAVPNTTSALVATRDGQVWMLDLDPGATAGEFSSRPILDIRSGIDTKFEQQGLLGLAVDAEGSTVFLSYTEADNSAHIDRYVMPAPGIIDTSTRRELLRTPADPKATSRGAGALAMSQDGTLLASFVDECPLNRGEFAESWTKVVQVDPSSGELLSSDPGFRNPWQISIDRVTGDLYVGDLIDPNGCGGADAPDQAAIAPWAGGRIIRVGHSGLMTASVPPFEPGRATPAAAQEPAANSASIRVLYDYPGASGSSCGIIGGLVYRGQSLPGLSGRYLYADYCGGLYSISTEGAQDLRPVQPTVRNIVSLNETAEGEVIVITRDGQVQSLRPI